jgi:thymidylate synthase (FAD)
MGDALTIVNAARVSFGSMSGGKLADKDKKLIKFLADNKHMSPFEHCTLSVKITCPLYIRSQIHRHRTFAYNEISRRYTSKNMEFYTPDVLRKQSQSNRQASYGALGDQEQQAVKVEIEENHQRCVELYESLLTMGVCREQARGVLPQDLMTEFYMTGNLRNWAHFLSLRDKEDAQYEVQVIAKQVKDILLSKFDYAAEVLLQGDKKCLNG